MLDGIVKKGRLKTDSGSSVKIHERRDGYCQFSRIHMPKKEEEKKNSKKQGTGKAVTAWEESRTARSGKRLTALDYIETVFDGFLEPHGDRLFGDDSAVAGGLALLDGQPVTVIGVQKGRTTKKTFPETLVCLLRKGIGRRCVL